MLDIQPQLTVEQIESFRKLGKVNSFDYGGITIAILDTGWKDAYYRKDTTGRKYYLLPEPREDEAEVRITPSATRLQR